MPEHNTLDDRLRGLEERVGRLERQSVGGDGERQASRLADVVNERIEKESLDVSTSAIGQLEFSVLIRHKDSTFGMNDSVMLEKLMAAPAESLAKSIGGLGHPVRIDLYRALLTGPKESTELLEIAELNTTGQLYHHLQAMADVGLVERRSRNLWACQNQGAFAMMLGAGRILSGWRGED